MARRTKNCVEIIGFVGNPIEVKSKNDKPYARFSLATTESWGQGEARQERTEWHEMVIFGASAERLAKYTRKGSYIQVEGKLRYQSYTKEGEQSPRRTASIVVEEFMLLDLPESARAPMEDAPPPQEEEDHIPF